MAAWLSRSGGRYSPQCRRLTVVAAGERRRRRWRGADGDEMNPGMLLTSASRTFSRLSALSSRCTMKWMHTAAQTVDSREMQKFQMHAYKWWDEEGVYAALHTMNDLRVPFIRDTLINRKRDHDPGRPLAGVTLLDVGCGGGLLSEPLGILGAAVTGIDPLKENIRTAELHKSFDPVLAKQIQYKTSSLEEIVAESTEAFDAVVASEVVEHVGDVESFIKCCHQVLKPGGSLFITTISKTMMSYALGIVVAERIMGIVPAGIHDWEKFVLPEELERLLESNGFVVETLSGMLYNPFCRSWSWMENTSLNYAMHAVKTIQPEEPASTEPAAERKQEQAEDSTSSAL
ncbi:ubiquinone biosynthesis O-methyltransferase, mitochondrial [Rhinatrema bivittatum]|uniref:ubiquinone biosynthesis O-methyltransferase, mitochondrial n=1 Tax=Rhinatrema bivittatum TaxID=194408 RepID=UPI00112A5C93|nr:ubiquinone biosynthesis O-methyltransferase, mitochondrial [Rhinatrema bivittatum]